MVDKYQLLAYVSIFLVSINLFPQIYIIIKNKKATNISYLTYILTTVSSLLLTIYAYHFKLLPILIGNTMVFINSIIILFLKYHYS